MSQPKDNPPPKDLAGLLLGGYLRQVKTGKALDLDIPAGLLAGVVD
jgi:hypothetical protein